MAIGILPIKYIMENPDIENLILVGGDDDLIDMVEFMQKKLRVNVYIFAWPQSSI